jgi:hypothetical protein
MKLFTVAILLQVLKTKFKNNSNNESIKKSNTTIKSSKKERLKIVADYQVTQAQNNDTEEKRRMETIKKFYDLPSRQGKRVKIYREEVALKIHDYAGL